MDFMPEGPSIVILREQAHLGRSIRRSFFCERCQVKYE
jgi:hypothetical protein